MLKKLYRIAALFSVGGILYFLVKLLCTMYVGNFMPYWATILIGGASFISIVCINGIIPSDFSLTKRSFIGTLAILLIEFICGCILNLWLGLGVCDYSDIPFGLYSQSRLQSIIGYFLLAGIAIVMDGYLCHWFLGYEKQNYQIIGNKKRKKKKEKTEFSKILVTWSLVLTTLCVVLSYILSFTDHDPASDVTVSVSSACIAIAVAYEAKSFGEKNSRNKYGIDKNGYKIRSKENDDEDVVG